jgi:hypothetical protein
MMFLIALIAIIAIAFHGHRHPIEATMDGAEISAWQHDVLASKGVPTAPLGQQPRGELLLTNIPSQSEGNGPPGGAA